MNVSLCYKAIHNTVSIHTKKDMPSGLVEVADFRSSRTQKRTLFGLVSLPLQILLSLGHRNERMPWMFLSVLCGKTIKSNQQSAHSCFDDFFSPCVDELDIFLRIPK